MSSVVMVGLGGLAGSVCRYWMSQWMTALAPHAKLPFATLAVNVAGCLVIGLIAGIGERIDWPGPAARLFLVTGLLGGFTTFSAFGLDTLILWRRDGSSMALAFAALSVVICIAAVAAGIRLAHVIAR
jgi:CrcB protein